MTRGRRGSLRLRRMTLSFTAPRRCDRRTETTMTLLESLSTDLRRLHDVLDKSLDGLTTDQLHTVPAGHPKANTIAWNLWHYARTEDNVVRFVLQDRRPTVWVEGGYPERLGLHPAAQGTGMSTEEAHALRIRDVPLFAGYMKKVWASTEEYVQTLSAAEIGRQREVETPFQRLRIPAERQSRRRATKVGVVGRERERQPIQIGAAALVDDVDVGGETRRAVHRCRNAADENELHPALRQDAEKRLEVRHRAPEARPVRRSSSANSWSWMRASRRCSIDRRRLSRINERSTCRLYASMTGSDCDMTSG